MKLLLILFFFPIILLAQNNTGVVSYKYFVDNKEQIANLYLKPGYSLYKLTINRSGKKTEVKSNEEENNLIFNVNLNKDIPDNLGLLTDLKNKNIIEHIYIPKGFTTKVFDTLFIKENINIIKWEITTETKKIDRFLCQKAIGYFRGRLFNAWFTSEIPVNFGPWKLNGLPGLILEAYDTQKKFIFIAEKIEFNTKVEIDEHLFLEKTYITPIEKREIEYKVLNIVYDEIMGKIKSKLPRGTNTITKKTSEKIVDENTFIEIKFDDISKPEN